MYQYEQNGLKIKSDLEIRELRNFGEDIDLIIHLDLRVLNLEIDGMPDYISDRFQLTEVKSVMIRHTLIEDNKTSTIHFLRNIDLNTSLMNFSLDYSKIYVEIMDKDTHIDMKLIRY